MQNLKIKELLLKSAVIFGFFPLGVPVFAEGEGATAGGEVAVQTGEKAEGESSKVVPAAEDDADVAFRYPYIGVALEILPPSKIGGGLKPGVRVVFVLKDSPADKAGVRKGDILTTIDNQKIFFPNQFSALIRTYEPGSKIEIGVLRDGNELRLPAVVGQRKIFARPPSPESVNSDDIRLYINGREFSFGDSDAFEHISLTPDGIFIREEETGFTPEVRRLVSRIHAQMPDPQRFLTSLRQRYEEARRAAIGKTRQTFSQVFFGRGNTVIIVGNEKGRQVTVSREGDDEILYRGKCTTQEEIDAIPDEAKAIIESFTKLKPFTPEVEEDAKDGADATEFVPPPPLNAGSKAEEGDSSAGTATQKD